MSAEGLTGLLRSFRLPTMAAIWQESVAQAERENWGYECAIRSNRSSAPLASSEHRKQPVNPI